MRSTQRRNIKKVCVQEFWESCAQNKTSEISKNALSGILGLLWAEQNVGNLKNGLTGMLGLLRTEQDIGNIKKCTFRNYGTPVRRTRRRKSQKMNTFGTHLENIEHIWNTFGTHGAHCGTFENTTTESAKAFLSTFASGELGTRTGGTGSPDAGEPVPPATLTNFYSRL